MVSKDSSIVSFASAAEDEDEEPSESIPDEGETARNQDQEVLPPPDRPKRKKDDDKQATISDSKVKEKEMSIYRSKEFQEVMDVYQSCLRCKDLFAYLSSKKELRKVLDKIQSHPLWQAVHIASNLGVLVFLADFKPRDPKIIKLLNTPCQPEGLYPLHIAVGKNHIELMKVLLKLGASIGQTDVEGCNALHHGARASSPMIDALCEHEEAKQYLNSQNRDGCTPLFVAVRCANPMCANALLKQGAELNILCKGRSPLFEAMQQNDGAKTKELVKAVVAASKDVLEEVNPATGNSALHVALYKQPLGALLGVAGDSLNINVRNKAGQTAVHVHTHRGDIGCVVSLASFGADLNAQDSNGHTPLHIACSVANLDLVRAFLVLGADPNVQNYQGDTPRHVAARLKTENKADIVNSLSIYGAERCKTGKIGCGSGCADKKSPSLAHTDSAQSFTSSVDLQSAGEKAKVQFDLEKSKQQKCIEKMTKWAEEWKQAKEQGQWGDTSWVDRAPKLVCLLSLDGGGIRGLVLLQVLMSIERILGDSVIEFFDWTAGTSTGSFVAAALSQAQPLWKSLRYSSAAPTYFTRADNCYVDGGLIANNPTLDLMGEVDNWNAALDHHGRPQNEQLKIGCVLSIGTGKIPNVPLESLDIGFSQNPYTQAMAMKNLGIMFVDQVTATDGAPVERARAWCHSLGIPYFRFSTPMSKDLMMDTTDDKELVNLMWEASVYVHENQGQLQQLADLLKVLKACKDASGKPGDVSFH